MAFTRPLIGSQKVSMFNLAMSIEIPEPSLLSSCASGELLVSTVALTQA